MRLYALKTCDTCRKALRALRAADHDPQVIDVRDHGLDAEDLAALLSQVGDAVVNRASTTWRGLSDTDRARPPADLLADHPTLLKRPAIERDGRWTVGWSDEVQAVFLR